MKRSIMEGKKIVEEYNDGTFSFTLTIYDEAFENGEGEIVSGSFDYRDECDKAATRIAEALNIELID